MAEPRFVPMKDGALILGLQFFLLVFRLGSVPLLGPDEPRYARVAIEMARANEFVRPTLQGEAWLEKPPLYYWLAGAGYRLIGETETAARWPAVFAALLMTGATGLVTARLFGAGTGRVAMLILATSPLAFAYGRAATMDMLVAAFITAAIGLFLLRILGIAGHASGTVAWMMIAFAVLAKGPIGLLIPVGFAAISAVALRTDLRRLLPLNGLVAFLLIVTPWFAAIYADQGFHFVEVFILNHNLERFTSTIHNHPGPFYYYLPVLLLGLLPWTGLITAVPASWRSMDRPHLITLGAWIAVPLFLFSAAGSKLPGYILPALPPFAAFLAVAARELSSGIEKRGTARAAGLIGLIVSAATVALSLRAARAGEVWGRSALMLAIWLLATTFLASRTFDRARGETVRVLSIGGAGFLLLLTLLAPPFLEAMESGRRLFIPANHREVLAVGAWRTAWMSGYFYNDGKVREVAYAEALALAASEPRIALFGPKEWSRLSSESGFEVLKLAEGPRSNVLVRVSRKAAP